MILAAGLLIRMERRILNHKANIEMYSLPYCGLLANISFVLMFLMLQNQTRMLGVGLAN